MRAFLGLAPDPATKLAIEAWRNQALPDLLKPVPAKNFHLTLAFLGKIETKQLDKLTERIDSAVETKAFDVSLNMVGYWPKPKALWLGCDKASAEHIQLAKYLRKHANSIGLNLPKQDYVPHLTLARKCDINPPAPLSPPQFCWRAEQFHLYESISTANGVTYQIRQTWSLAHSFKH